MKGRLLPLTVVDDGFVDRWRRLGARAVEPNPFAEPDVALPAARWLADESAASLLVVEDGRSLAFALPLVRGRAFRGVPVPAVLPWRHSYTGLSAPLVAPDDPAGAWAEALAVLDDTAGWAVFPGAATCGPVADGLAEALRRTGRSVGRLERPGRPVVRRRPEPSYLHGTVSGRRRKNLRRMRRRLGEALGGEVVRIDHAHDEGRLATVVEDFLRVEAAGWKGADGGAMLCRPGHADFFRELVRRFAGQQRLQLWSLGVAGRAVAYQCNLLAGRQVFHFRVAFDERFARYSPGVQLELDMIDEFHADRRFDLIDSCTGNGVTVSRQIYPDLRPTADLMVPLHGRLGRAAARGTPPVAAAYRRVKRLAVPARS